MESPLFFASKNQLKNRPLRGKRYCLKDGGSLTTPTTGMKRFRLACRKRIVRVPLGSQRLEKTPKTQLPTTWLNSSRRFRRPWSPRPPE